MKRANRIYNKNCLEGMKSISNNSIDLIITDPPFAIDFKSKKANYNRTAHRVLDGYKEIPKNEYYDFTRNWIKGSFRILKNTGSMYVFSGWNNLKDILNALDEIGFTTTNHIIWKYQFGVVTRKKFVTSHYHCLFVCKDEKTPTKLPAELIKKMLSYSSEEGDIVFDPFLGSGQVAIVSKMMKRKFLGFEIVKEYFEFASQRLKTDTYRLKSLKEIENKISVNKWA